MTASRPLPRSARPLGTTATAMLAGAAITTALFVLAGMAQPDRPGRDGGRPDQPGDRPPQGGPGRLVERDMTPADLRARLVNRLNDARIMESRLEQAIADLDAGRTPAEALTSLWSAGMPRFDRPGDGPRPGPEERTPLTAEDRQRLMDDLRQRMPRVAEWIAQLEGEDPRVMDLVRNRLLPRMREIDDLRRRDPQAADIRTTELIATIGVMRATRDYRQTALRDGPDSAPAAAAREALRQSLIAQFDARLASTQHEIEALGRRIESLRGDVASQSQGRDTLIDAALDRITQDALRPAPALQQTPPPAP